MRHFGNAQLMALLVALLAMTGCATVKDQEWVKATREASAKMAHTVVEATSRTTKSVRDYVTDKELLKTFQDAGEHSEAAVLDILHKAGIGQTTGQSKGKSQRPPKTPTPRNGPMRVPETPEQFAGSLRWPLDSGTVSSEYGNRHGKMHKGMDIAAPVGLPVHASAGGEVIYAGNGLSGYGNVVILRHDKQMTSLYAHNSSLKVRVGDQVSQGDVIALLGNTGRSTGPHVHFEIREGDTHINPRTLLPVVMLAETAAAPRAVALVSR